MNVKEKYNKIIYKIEEIISNITDTTSVHEIATIICESEFLSIREINTIFKFLIGMSLQQYIRERRLTAACSYLITSELKEIENAIIISGYDNQSSFTKAFSLFFGCSPEKAKENFHDNDLMPPRTWECISEDEIMEYVKSKKMEYKYGIDKDLIMLYEEALDYQELYELHDNEGEIAFRLANELKVELEVAFRSIYYLHISDAYYFNFEDIEDSVKEIIEDYGNEIILLQSIGDYTLHEARCYCKQLLQEGVDIRNIDPDIFEIYMYSDSAECTYYELEELYKEYKQETSSPSIYDFIDNMHSIISGEYFVPHYLNNIF